MDSKDELFISCYFGTNPKIINMAPNKSSYFFTNNLLIKDLILSKNWKFVYINFPLSNDLLICSLQSKYIKFLQFLKHYKFFNKFKTIFYFDHKEQFNYKVYQELQTHFSDKDFDILIRKSNFTNSTVKDEIKRSMLQLKYSKNMHLTKAFIEKIDKQIYNFPVFNTGLIVFFKIEKTQPMLDELYKTLCFHLQPQCQIYFPIFAKKYKTKLSIINYNLKNLYRNKIEDVNLFSPGTIMSLKF